MNKLEDFLKQLDLPNAKPGRISGDLDPEQILKFSVNPLVSIIFLTEEDDVYYNGISFSNVFEDSDDPFLGYNKELLKNIFKSEPDYNEVCDLADEIIAHYKELFSLKKLKGLELYQFEEVLLECLNLMGKNQIKLKHLPILVKLPQFYQSDQTFQNTIRNMNSFDVDKNNKEISDAETQIIYNLKCKITPLEVFKKYTKKEKKEIMYLHFITEDNELIQWRTGNNGFIKGLFSHNEFLNYSLNAFMEGTYEIHPLTGFVYFKAHHISI